MKFRVQRREHPHQDKPKPDDFKYAKKFSDALQKELPNLIKAIVLFGSVARGESGIHEKDIDVLVIVDDLSLILSPEVVESYRVITEQTAAKITHRLHITTMKLTNFWNYVRNGDPVAVNMLRDGLPLYDAGFFEPVQQLFFEGRIQPTRESVYSYLARAPITMQNADWHVMQACMDLYWAVIDAAHAALMKHGQVPPTPKHVPDMLQKVLVSKKHLHKKHVKTMKDFYDLNKGITHKTVLKMSGKQYDAYRIRANEFIDAMTRIVTKK